MQLSIDGKRALVCGGSQGIGRAVAEGLAAAGARVELVARDPSRLSEALAGLPGQRHRAHVVDLGDPGQVEALAAKLRDDGGAIEILVNNAGGPPPGALLAADRQAFLAGMSAHLLAAQALAAALVPGMRACGYGRIVNIVSTSVKEPLPGLGVSNTVRAAMAAWAKTLALELAADGITVNNVLPGYTDTARLRALIEHRARLGDGDVAAATARARAEVPMQRFATPAEIAAAVVFLCSPAASYITGINLPVDGGRTRCL